MNWEILRLTHQIEEEKKQMKQIEQEIIDSLPQELYDLLNWNLWEIELDPDAESEFKKELEEKFNEKIIWQESAKKAIINAIIRNISSIRSKKWPLWVFFFAWPSWVGKTQITRVLAEILLGSEDFITKIDCSEYWEDHTTRNLFWAPKSYVWYWEPTPLNDIRLFKPYNEAKKRNTIHRQISRLNDFSILLFDEIEKAHPKIHQSLLAAMDDGKINFPSWKENDKNLKYSQETDLSNTIIIFTSNVWNQEASKNWMWFVQDKWKKSKEADYINSFKRIFSPEFIGRINEFVTFDPLDKESLLKILKNEVQDISWHFWILEWNLWLQIDDDVLESIVDRSYNENYWARPVINDFVETIEATINNIISSWQLDELFELNKYYFTINVKLWENWKFKYTLSSEKKEEDTKRDVKEDLNLLAECIKYWFNEDKDLSERIAEIEDILITSHELSTEEVRAIRNEIYANMIKHFDMIHQFDDYEWITISSSDEKKLLSNFWRRNTKNIVDRKLNMYNWSFDYNDEEFIDYIVQIFNIVDELNWESLNPQQIKEVMKMIDSYIKNIK